MKTALGLLLAASCAVSAIAEERAIRRPAGIYAVLPLEEDAQTPRSRKRSDPNRLEALLQNGAVAGIALRARWRDLEPEEGKYDFAELDEALQHAATHHKTLQLIVVPGFLSPEWLLKELPSADPYLDDPSTAPAGFACGKATFGVPYGAKKGEVRELPLPWNRIYKEAWQTFLAELARRYGDHAQLVSIAVAGPTSISAEMSLPNKDDGELKKWRALLKLSFPPGGDQESNAAIVREWNAVIDFYGRTFSHLTLVATRGAGLLRFHPGDPEAAKEEILRHFLAAPVGQNLRSTQTSGMKASRDGEGGIEGVKELTRRSKDAPAGQRVLGGGQFDSSATRHGGKVGRRAGDAGEEDIAPAEAIRNVLRNFFNKTPFGKDYGAENGDAPIHYLQVYDEDILYANDHADVQAILLDVSRKLEEMNR